MVVQGYAELLLSGLTPCSPGTGNCLTTPDPSPLTAGGWASAWKELLALLGHPSHHAS